MICLKSRAVGPRPASPDSHIVEIVEIHTGACLVRLRGDDYDAGPIGRSEQRKQFVREEKVTQVTGCNVHLESIRALAPDRIGNSGIIHEHVDGAVETAHPRGERPDFVE